jgi:nucleotide-binding universal stress UspA family protein
MLLKGSIAGEVVRAAEELEADCIILGGWEHNSVFRDIIMEASREIANLAPCPVLLVRSRDAEKAYKAI